MDKRPEPVVMYALRSWGKPTLVALFTQKPGDPDGRTCMAYVSGQGFQQATQKLPPEYVPTNGREMESLVQELAAVGYANIAVNNRPGLFDSVRRRRRAQELVQAILA